MICTAGSTRCTATAPSFFSPWRYSNVLSEVRVGSSWKPVQQWNIYHTWGRDSAGKYPKMLVTQIQSVGLAQGGFLPYPGVFLHYTRHANRVDQDLAAGKDPMENWRLGRIVNELGGETRITYGQNRPCLITGGVPNYDVDRWD